MKKFVGILRNWFILPPFIGAIICLIVEKNTEGLISSDAETAKWVLFVTFACCLVAWLVIQGISWYKAYKES